jgi:hypothetical protein
VTSRSADTEQRPGEDEDEQQERITRELGAIDPDWSEYLSLDWFFDK